MCRPCSKIIIKDIMDRTNVIYAKKKKKDNIMLKEGNPKSKDDRSDCTKKLKGAINNAIY